MELSLVLEQRFVRTPDGRVWTHGPLHAGFWQRYLRDFESLTIIARVQNVGAVPEGWREVLRERVFLHPIPAYIGPLQFLQKQAAVRRAMKAALAASPGALILRTPGNLSALAGKMLLSSRGRVMGSLRSPRSSGASQSSGASGAIGAPGSSDLSGALGANESTGSLGSTGSIGPPGLSASPNSSNTWRQSSPSPTRSRPFGVEVVGDPEEVFAPEAISHPLRPFFRQHFSTQQRRLCQKASAALYVSEHQLPKRYPCPGFTSFASNVELTPESFAAGPRVELLGGSSSERRTQPKLQDQPKSKARLNSEEQAKLADRLESGARSGPADPLALKAPRDKQRARGPGAEHLRVVFVGTLEQLYKGPDVLLKAMAICRSNGIRIHATLVGEGRLQGELERLGRELKLEAQLHFTGFLPSPKAVRQQLGQADAFVLPSRTEGLPRAMLEAMAQGLPCVGSSAGGMPELLPTSAMCRPGDERGLATLLMRLVRDEKFRQQLAAHGFATAQRYREEILDGRRRAFYQALIKASASSR